MEEESQQKTPIEYHEAWKTVCSANGIIVPGGFGTRGIEGKILAAKYAREKHIPYLGELHVQRVISKQLPETWVNQHFFACMLMLFTIIICMILLI